VPANAVLRRSVLIPLALPCPALPYPTLPYPTLPYPVLPYPARRPSLSSLSLCCLG